jgi:hypothetical protein
MIITKNKDFFKYDLKLIDDSIANLLVENSINFHIAGGCFTSQFSQKKINDIDVFFTDEFFLKAAIDIIDKNPEYKTTFENDFVKNIYKREVKIQFVKKYLYKTTEDIFKVFDFTVCKFAYNGRDCYYNERFFFVSKGVFFVIIVNIDFEELKD